MRKLLCGTILTLVSAWAAASAALTEQETRWLTAGAPVLEYARQLKLPIDIIVQPQAGPDDVPLAMGFDKGRCKLVLSMRGNPQAEAILDNVAPEQRGVVIEAMTAHEVAHCWRYAQGVWHALPAGFVETGTQQAANHALLEQARELRETQREEGYSDLVALAWTELRHPERYAAVHHWLETVRAQQPVAGMSHDTRAWIRLAPDGAVFKNASTPFEGVAPLWNKGLLDAG